MTDVTQEFLLSILRYDTQTGGLFWRRRPREMFKSDHEFGRWNTRYSETPALTARIDGYPMGHIMGKPYKAHRVIFFMHYGYWPEYVDHLNGVRHDNRIENLRAATKVENGRNQKMNARNKSGYAGVSWYPPGKKWRAWIGNAGKREYLGQFETKDEAIAVRKLSEHRLGFSARHGT